MLYDFTQPEDLHVQQKITPERDMFLVLMLLVTLVIECFVVSSALHGKVALALCFHAFAFLLMFMYAKLKSSRGKDARFAWVAASALPLMGPFASGGVLFALLWFFLSKGKSLTFEEWRESIFPTEHKSLAQTVYERIAFGRDQAGENYSVTYLMDVLKMGSDEKKREAIFKISRYYDPGLAPLLKIALEDPHNVIRIQAATAMARLKNTFFSKSLLLEKLRRDWPEKNRILLDLARHYDNYAFSGLLEKTQELENRLLALQYYRNFLEKESKDSSLLAEAHQFYGRLLLRMDMVEAACREFEKLREDGLATPDINLWYSECLFKLQRYAALRIIARENVASPLTTDSYKYPDNIRDTIKLWAGPQEGAVA